MERGRLQVQSSGRRAAEGPRSRGLGSTQGQQAAAALARPSRFLRARPLRSRRRERPTHERVVRSSPVGCHPTRSLSPRSGFRFTRPVDLSDFQARAEKAAASWAALSARAGLPDFDDRAVEHDVRVASLSIPVFSTLSICVSLVRRTGVAPAFQVRSVTCRPEPTGESRSHGLRTEHRELPRRGPALDEEDLRQALHAADPGRVVDVHHGRFGLARHVRVQVRVFVAVVVAVKCRPRDLRRRTDHRDRADWRRKPRSPKPRARPPRAQRRASWTLRPPCSKLLPHSNSVEPAAAVCG